MPEHKKILMILLRNIGDVVLTTPATRVLKAHYPDVAIDFVANPAPAQILENNPNLNEIIPYPYKPDDILGAFRFSYDLFKRNYDISIDFLGTPATALMSLASRAEIRVGFNLRIRRLAYTHFDQNYKSGLYNALTKFTLLKPLGIEKEESRTEIFVTEEASTWVDRIFQDNGWNDRTVALSTCAMRDVRCWLPERYAEVANWLNSQGCRVLLTWGPGEREYVEKVHALMKDSAEISPPTTLMQLAALLQKCRMLVCNCSGTKHIAVAVGTPTMTIHGPSEPSVWTPSGDPKHAYVRAENIDCLGCGESDCDHLTCMKDVSSEMVIDAIQQMNVLS
ncbi:hypothetical protein CEE37_04020 [candidate division LCP-89 bacterium B3_LCP]|uniref:Lipopolysaccharide heptosyltransferase II n=1 Tax=candidate division LCP-89 bacterium B3_LCP TaxID=2012998 RepID=A0A532V3E8_UNCL8|nr:MAG: hypothetical protein CEE37_04020 [candidate division LCP-89 bacterium B3_LCP]